MVKRWIKSQRRHTLKYGGSNFQVKLPRQYHINTKSDENRVNLAT